MRITCLFYCLSGFVSLAYQVAWFRIFVDRFGSTNLTFGLVLCNFIGGLGVGALASERVCDSLGRRLRIDHPLRLYGLIELLIAVSVLLTALTTLIPPAAWGHFPYQLSQGVYHLTISYQLARIAVATGCVFIPAFLMGVTFPLLCRVFQHDDRFPSTLYGWNTLGASVGILACEFVFLPRVGHDRTLLIMVVINAAIGAFFLTRARHIRTETPDFAPARRRPPSESARPYPYSVALTGAVLSGLLAGALEGDLFKRLWFVGCNSSAGLSFISLSAVLAIFLGSFSVRAVPRLRLVHIKIAFVLALASHAVMWRFAYPLQDWVNARHAAVVVRAGSGEAVVSNLQSGLIPLLVYVAISIVPTFYLISLLLPYLCNRLHRDGRHLGTVYGLNTVAFCIGTIGFTWIAPRANVFYSTKLFFGLFAVVVVLLLLVSETRSVARWKPIAAVAVFAALCALTPSTFDKRFFRATDLPARFPVRALRSNAAHTIYVVADPRGDRLFFDNYSMSTTTRSAQQYMRLMAHFPLLAHPNPRDALLICFGVGNTASAIATHETIRRIDVVDLNDPVYAIAPEFAATNQRVYADARLTLIHDDGRNFLAATDRTYDLVTSEPPPPMEHGVYRLYSREYYAAVMDHLNPGGMMTQWLPVNQMPREAVELAARTFVASFPHTLLFVGVRHQFILVGSNAPIALDRLAQRFDEFPSVVADLKRVGITGPVSLLARVVKLDVDLRRDYGTGRLISDQHNPFAHLFLDPRDPAIVTYNPAAVLNAFPAALGTDLRPMLLHLGRLRAIVPDFPPSTLNTVRDNAADVMHAEADWLAIDALQARAERAFAERRFLEAIAFLTTALQIADQQPHVLRRLAELQMLARQPAAAVATGRRLVALEPDDAGAHHTLGAALSYIRQNDEALQHLELAGRLSPETAAIHKAYADVLATTGRYQDALSAYDRALALAPDDTNTRQRREQVVAIMKQAQP